MSGFEVRASRAILTGVALSIAACGAHAQGAREIPSVIGPIAGNTAANHPFDGASFLTTPIDLAARGYREDEYFLHGTANVYQLANVTDPSDTSVNVLRSGPYTNRILVERPTDPRRFSGNVVVEILNATNHYDLPILWSYANQYFTRRGDVWIGITGKPVDIATLKLFNPSRYASLSWANPNPNETDATCPVLYSLAGIATHATEDGLLWDIFSQTAALVRSASPSNPLHGYNVRAVYGSGYSQSAWDLVGYINDITPLTSGRIFDGYLVASSFGSQLSLNQCSPAPAGGDPRNILRSRNTPIIATQTQTDYHEARAAYRTDSDAADDRYRYYEAAGAAHLVAEQLPITPNTADVLASGGETLSASYASCDAGPLSTFPARYLIDAALMQLESWVRLGTTPPHAAPIATTGAPPATVTALDGHGNGVGGVRAPELDVPVATYTESANNSSLNCSLAGKLLPFSAATLQSLYPRPLNYLGPFATDALHIAEEGFLTPDDAIGAVVDALGRVPLTRQ
jgi:hypothetical protein